MGDNWSVHLNFQELDQKTQQLEEALSAKDELCKNHTKTEAKYRMMEQEKNTIIQVSGLYYDIMWFTCVQPCVQLFKRFWWWKIYFAFLDPKQGWDWNPQSFPVSCPQATPVSLNVGLQPSKPYLHGSKFLTYWIVLKITKDMFSFWIISWVRQVDGINSGTTIHVVCPTQPIPCLLVLSQL